MPEDALEDDEAVAVRPADAAVVVCIPEFADPCPIGTPWCVDHSDDDFEGSIVELCEGPIWTLDRFFVSITGRTLGPAERARRPEPAFTLHAEHLVTPGSLRGLSSAATLDLLAVLKLAASSGVMPNELECAASRLFSEVMHFHQRVSEQ